MVEKFLKIAIKDLFKINRSITGSGLRKTLKIYKDNFKELKIRSTVLPQLNQVLLKTLYYGYKFN